MQHMTRQEMLINAQVGHAIDSYLKWRRHSRAELARLLDVADTTLRQKIKGIRPWSFYEVATAAAFLDVPIDELVAGSQNLKVLTGITAGPAYSFAA